MKKLFLSLLMLAASSLQANVVTPYEMMTAGSEFTEASATYTTLSTITPGAATLGVTLTGSSIVYLRVTGTAGVLVQFADTNTASAYRTVGRLGADSYGVIRKFAPYVRFVGSGAVTSGSFANNVTPYATVKYLLTTSGVTAQPASLSAITLTAAITWNYQAVTCTSQPCTVEIFNQSPSETMAYWIDRSTSAPSFSGLSLSVGSLSIVYPVTPGDVFHWRYSASPTANGFLINRY